MKPDDRPTLFVVQHVPWEGPHRILDACAGLRVRTVKPLAGQPLPNHDEVAGAVFMGGPMNVDEVERFPALAAEREWLAEAVERELPVLGICLGAQLLAEATGGRVKPGEAGPELGARLVAKRDAAIDDPLFADLPLSPMVVQWHWDAVVDLPPGALLLAASPRYPHQAFRVGAKAYGLQFHIETPPEMVRAWATADAEGVRAAGLDPDDVAERAVDVLPEIEEVWRPFAERFAALVRGETRTYLPVV